MSKAIRHPVPIIPDLRRCKAGKCLYGRRCYYFDRDAEKCDRGKWLPDGDFLMVRSTERAYPIGAREQ